MYRRSSFRDQLLIEQCREIVALEERLRELDSMLEAVATGTACAGDLRVRRAGSLGLALLRELRAAGRRRGGRRLPGLRASACG